MGVEIKLLIELIIGLIVAVSIIIVVGFYFRDNIFTFFRNLGGVFFLGLI